MIDWGKSGVWGDENTPDVSASIVPIFGTRISPIVDLSSCLEKLGDIRSGWAVWLGDEPENTSLEIDISVDGGQTFRQVKQREPIPECHSEMELVIRQRLRSQMTEIQPDLSPVLSVLVVYLSSEGAMVWDRGSLRRLQWR